MALLDGEMKVSPKLSVGYYAQHQTEELNKNLTAFQQLKTVMGDANETKIRTRLGAFGLGRQKADTLVEKLSGGEKSRLLFAMMSRNSPHVLILDEPTNHLDIDARNALTDAINDFAGAVILITHDPHLIELTADRLWLVADGTCRPFDGDMDDYRALLAENHRVQNAGNAAKVQTSDNSAAARKDERRLAAEKRRQDAPRRKKLKETEEALEKQTAERRKIHAKLEDPALYSSGTNPAEITALQQRAAELDTEIERLETLWLELSEQGDS